MLPQTNIIRAAVRHAPRLRPTVPPSLGVSSLRFFSSTPATRDGEHDSIVKELDAAQLQTQAARVQTST